jgi:hypothetical protein
MAGLFGIGGSAAKTDRSQQLSTWGDLSSLAGQSQSIAQQQAGAGNTALNAGQNYFQSLLSNQPGAVSQAVSPAVNTLLGQEEQQKQTTAEFGNRSGGTNSAIQSLTSTTSGDITNLINSLIPNAANSLATIGNARLGAGISSMGQAENTEGELGTLIGQARPEDVKQQQQQGQEIGEAAAMLALL